MDLKSKLPGQGPNLRLIIAVSPSAPQRIVNATGQWTNRICHGRPRSVRLHA